MGLTVCHLSPAQHDVFPVLKSWINVPVPSLLFSQTYLLICRYKILFHHFICMSPMVTTTVTLLSLPYNTLRLIPYSHRSLHKRTLWGVHLHTPNLGFLIFYLSLPTPLAFPFMLLCIILCYQPLACSSWLSIFSNFSLLSNYSYFAYFLSISLLPALCCTFAF